MEYSIPLTLLEGQFLRWQCSFAVAPICNSMPLTSIGRHYFGFQQDLVDTLHTRSDPACPCWFVFHLDVCRSIMVHYPLHFSLHRLVPAPEAGGFESGARSD